MMALKFLFPLITLLAFSLMIQAQRPPYAGSRPNGYKDRFRPTRPVGVSSINEIDNRFGENTSTLETDNVPQRAPIGVEIVYGEAPSSNDAPVESQQLPEIDNRQQLETDEQQQPIAINTEINPITNNPTNLSSDLATGSGDVPLFNRVTPVQAVTDSGRLPHDAHGDRPLVNLLYQRPVDKRPFWLVNYQAIEAHRNGTNSSPPASPSSTLSPSSSSTPTISS